MSGTPSTTSNPLGMRVGQVVQELGWDEDVDDDLRSRVMDAIDADLVEETDSADAVLLWWREDDGDLADGLVDALTDLNDEGVIWLLTPKVGRPAHVEAADIAEAVVTAGLSQTRTVSLGGDWQPQLLVRPRGRR